MRVRYWFDLAQELLVTTFEGTLRNSEVEDVLRAEFADARTAETTRHLIDITRATNSDATADDLRRRAALVGEYLGRHPRGRDYRMALLVRADVDYGLGRMFEVFVRDMGHTRVFRDRDEALEWLGVQFPEDPHS